MGLMDAQESSRGFPWKILLLLAIIIIASVAFVLFR